MDQATSITGSRRRILVIGGSAERRADLTGELSAEFDLQFVDTGAEATAFLAANGDVMGLALLVLPIPDMSGLELLKRIDRDPLLMKTPVAVLSDDHLCEAESLMSGAIDYICTAGLIPGVLAARARHAMELSENRNMVRSIERDPLTGLYNKDFFFNYAIQYDTFHREAEMDAIVINISHFHTINERYGKAYGDDVLRRIGKQVKEYAGAGSIACRRDGDTFLIYAPHREDYEALLEGVSQGLDDRVRLRMGVYPRVDKALDIERRFDRAKLASDTVRGNFNRRVAFYDDKLRKSEIYIEQLLEDFPKAIEEGQFVVYYQPKFAIQGTMPVLDSAEALVRWQHPRMGLISPGDFIPLFESNGLIRQLDSYVWRTVAAQMKDWKDRLGVCVPVSVNVSRVDIFDQDLVEHMTHLVDEFDLSPEEFLLEITESAYTQDSQQIIDTVKRLRDAGFHIEIDDFGSGYSSLNMISTVPMDALKLDMEFMRNAFRERKNTRMLDAVIDIAYSLEVPTIAEGVETAEQMFALKEMGCEVVQGYYFSRPVPAEEYERFLIEKKNGRLYVPDRERESGIKPAEQFAYEALHDPLTGLYNHSAYKMLLKDADQRNIALLLGDVAGDRAQMEIYDEPTLASVAELVADVLRHNFRSVDFICRIGPDEFAVIMTRVNSELRPLVAEKVDRINKILQDRRGNLPLLGLMVGVAFADRENPRGDIFQDADCALQTLRENERVGCAIY